MSVRYPLFWLWLMAVWLLVGSVFAQPAPGEVGDALNALLSRGMVSRWLKNEPITTSIRDVNKRVDLADSFGNDASFKPIHRRPRTVAGGYLLSPGFYELRSRSYCIRAGTHAPSNGDGYLYAPLLGRQADIVAMILANSDRHPNVDQHTVQLLLWAIIARSDFQSMNSELVGAATTLLTTGQLVRLNKQAIVSMALSLINSPELTASLRSVFSAEHQIRQAFSQAQTSFQELEQLAMLVGPALVDNPDIRRGRWSKHPDGYYIRYFPAGYSQTVIQVHVPAELASVEFDATNDVAVPANTGAQRLALSNVPFDTTGYAPEAPVITAQGSVPAPTPAPPIVRTAPTPKPDPPAVVYQGLCGQVLDINTGTAIAGASVQLGSQRLVTDAVGKFDLAKLLVGQRFDVATRAVGYEETDLTITIQYQVNCQPLLIYLQPVAVPQPPATDAVLLGTAPVHEGDRLVLENIQFNQSSSELLPDGLAELDKVATWLLQHETITIELSGHTSDEGLRPLNIRLSKERVAACKKYLIQKGIAASRTQTVGYGPDRPIVSNDTPGKARNRRVELKIVHL